MKYRIVTLGCKVNTYESEAVRQLLDAESFSYSSIENNNDLLVINTCSVTSVSDAKCRQRIRKEIKMNPAAIVIIMGCYAQMSSEFVATMEGVNIIIGTNSRHDIPKLIRRFQRTGKQINVVKDIRQVQGYENLSVTSYVDNTRAFLKIQDGCDNFCSYCIIPYARGKLRSRERLDIIKEAKKLIKNGYKEIVLTGIHTAGYGRDLENYNFTDLVTELLQLKGLVRLRISSIEESEITQEFIDLLKTSRIIAHHLHIPLQSGSEEVLKRMNRKYDKAAFLETLQRIREACPDISITTDVIVGFPGETDEEFQETYDFIQKCNFAKLHVFPFSPRSGTPASRMEMQVGPLIKKALVNQLLQLSLQLENSFRKQFVGTLQEVIIEEFDESKQLYYGHSSNYLEVYVDSTEDIRGKLVAVNYKILDSVKQ